eukprot:scaffold16990_cov79-Cyclotella_meneghiniana.AAC.6
MTISSKPSDSVSNSSTTSSERRRNRRAKALEWWETQLSKPRSDIASLLKTVTEGFPKSTFSSQVVKSFQGQVYEHVMTNFHNKRSLKCISNVSSSEARSKLLGFLVCMHAGHVDFPPMCQVSKSHIVPRAFKYYVPLEDEEFPEESKDVEMEDCDESEKSPTWDEAKALLSSRKEWFRRVITGSLNPVKSFGNREVHLEGRTFRYDRDYWDKKSSSPRFDWPRPSTANQIMYLIFVHGWGGLTNTLQSMSTVSHADALNKAFHYSSYLDAGLADSTNFPSLNDTAHIVPYNFDGYPQPSSFLATAIIEPDESLHPVQNMIGAGRIILLSGRDVDPDFEMWAVHEELIATTLPLNDPSEDKFPTTNKEICHYTKASPWQLTKIREGQKGPDGKQKKQGRIYATIRIHSKFEPQVIIGHLKPDLDALDIGLNLKGVQLPATEVKYALFGVNPNSCPEGLRRMILQLLYKTELEAAVKRKTITDIKGGSADLGDLYLCKKGIKVTKLVHPKDKERLGVEQFESSLRLTISIETPISRTKVHSHMLNSASESQTLKTTTVPRWFVFRKAT